MARAVPTPLRPRTPRYSDSIACESHLEAAEAARRGHRPPGTSIGRAHVAPRGR